MDNESTLVMDRSAFSKPLPASIYIRIHKARDKDAMYDYNLADAEETMEVRSENFFRSSLDTQEAKLSSGVAPPEIAKRKTQYLPIVHVSQ